MVCSQEAKVTGEAWCSQSVYQIYNKGPGGPCSELMDRSYYLSKSNSKMNALFARETGYQIRDRHHNLGVCTVLGSAKQCSILAEEPSYNKLLGWDGEGGC